MMHPKRQAVENTLGWLAVILVTLAAGFWAFWGAIEAFHEGWCRPHLHERLLQVAAYLSPAVVLAVCGHLSVRWPRVGGGLLLLIGVAVAGLITADGSRFAWQLVGLLSAAPVVLGLLFLIGRPRPKRLAAALPVLLPLVVAVVCGVEPACRVATRFDDGDRGSRLVEGNGVTLLWAPAGPGWTRAGLASWDEARRTAARLTDDGELLADEPLNIWRLPTREELVRSLTRDNANAGGVWDTETGKAEYATRPDKESPLWDPHAPLIYLWTSEEVDTDRAWIVVYHGGTFAKAKQLGSPSLGFRAVREPPP